MRPVTGNRCPSPRPVRSPRRSSPPGSGTRPTVAASRSRCSPGSSARCGTSAVGGAASLDCCAVGAGVVDAYYERGINPWDMAGGALVAQEAGAAIRIWEAGGDPLLPVREPRRRRRARGPRAWARGRCTRSRAGLRTRRTPGLGGAGRT
ncbi:inositol monophosphatase family protein [Curtobacterium flaccumfaciens pv. flaccumfaciens]